MPLKPDGDCHDLQARTGRRAKLAPSQRPQPVAKGGHRDKVHRRHPRRQPTATSRLTPPSPRFGYSSADVAIGVPTPTGTYTDPACPTGDPKDNNVEGLLLVKT